jgi:hypothetical protein
MFGVSPAYGLFVCHAKDISISDVEFKFMEPDYRPGLIFDDVDGVDLRNVAIQQTENSGAIVLKNIKNFNILQSEGFEDLKLKNIEQRELK